MIQYRDANQFTCLQQPTGNAFVLLRGFAGTGWEIVNTDQRGGPLLDCSSKNLTGMNQAAVQDSDAHRLIGDEAVANCLQGND